MDAMTVRGLNFSYGSARVLKDVEFSVQAGRFAVLLGQNGAGKSTLLKLTLGELALDWENGSIRLLGQDVRQFKDWRNISYVPQGTIGAYHSFPASVDEIVRANLYAQIGRFRFAGKKEKEQARQALSQVGMEGFGKELIGRLSGGQQQRVLLARALVNHPCFLILDEPTTGMDEKSTGDFYRLLKDINREQGVTVLMVTHDRKRLEPFADDMWLLEDGSMKQVRAGQEGKDNGTV